jgi:hypothetical protein
LNTDGRCNVSRNIVRHPLADLRVSFLGHFRGSCQAGSDGPDWFICCQAIN